MTQNHFARRGSFALPLLVSLLAPLIFSGCAVSPLHDEAALLAAVRSPELTRAEGLETQGKPAEAGKLYLELASKAQSPAREQLQIKASRAYLAAGQTARAKQIADGIAPQGVTAGQQGELLLIQADLAIAMDRPRDAIAYLQRAQARGLSEGLNVKRLGTLASAQRLSNDPVAAAQTLAELDAVLRDSGARLTNQVSLVSTLSPLGQSQLQTLARQGRGDMKGWAEIALLVQQNGAEQARLETRFSQWKQSNGGHPALPNLGRAYAERLSGGYKAGDQVIVMLPRGGRFADAARVIQDGIEAASRQDGGGQRPALDFSGGAAGPKAIQAAAEKGADFVIGPLEKPAVDALAASRTLPVPTLALNESTQGRRAGNLFQFSLSPENEAAEAAGKAAAAGMKRALVLYPKDAWGERIAGAFRRHWSNLGGSIVGQSSFDPSWASYDRTLAKLLDQGDADLLFLVATADMARKIHPQIRAAAKRPVPVVSTSHVYSGSFDPVADKGLVGLYFVDIPWMLSTSDRGPLSRQSLKGSASAAGPLGRLYAMGIDAYRLTPRLPSLAGSPGAYFPGQTGGLAVDSLGHIRRQLELGRFSESGPRLVGSMADGQTTASK